RKGVAISLTTGVREARVEELARGSESTAEAARPRLGLFRGRGTGPASKGRQLLRQFGGDCQGERPLRMPLRRLACAGWGRIYHPAHAGRSATSASGTDPATFRTPGQFSGQVAARGRMVGGARWGKCAGAVWREHTRWWQVAEWDP